MKIKFCVPTGMNRTITVQPHITVGVIRCLLSVVLDVPADSIILMHLARPLADDTFFHSLDFGKRSFVAVSVRRRVRAPIAPRESVAADSAPLAALVRVAARGIDDPVRDYILRNPACLPDLIARFARSDPATGLLFTENPHMLLAIFGISSAEFLDAIARAATPQPPPPPEPDPVGEFLDGLTPEDFRALQRVTTPDMPLSVVIPIFLEHHKDVAATIEQINRMTRSRS
jgi:hypothetical protein